MARAYQILDAAGSLTADNGAVSRVTTLLGAVGQRRLEGYLERGDGVRLYHCDELPGVAPEASPDGSLDAASAGARGAALVVLLHGYAEHCGRYDELAAYLLGRGHAVCRFDARGHGKSSGQRGHVHDFSAYVADLRAVLEGIARRHAGWPIVLLGHSNGGLVAIRALQEGLGVVGLVLTNPLIELRRKKKPVPELVARFLSAVAPRLPLPNGVVARDLTHDAALLEAHRQDPWVHRVATPRWYWSALLAGREALAAAGRVTLPVLIVRAELDPIVDPAAVAEFYERIASTDKELVTRPGEFHEVLNELDRHALFALIAAWLERVTALPRQAPCSSLT